MTTVIWHTHFPNPYNNTVPWRMCLLVRCNLYHKLPINFWTTEQKSQFINFVQGLSGKAWPVITRPVLAEPLKQPPAAGHDNQAGFLNSAFLTNCSKTLLSLSEPVLWTRLGKMTQAFMLANLRWQSGEVTTGHLMYAARAAERSSHDLYCVSKIGKVNDNLFLTWTLQKLTVRTFILQGCFLAFIKLLAKTKWFFFPLKVNT